MTPTAPPNAHHRLDELVWHLSGCNPAAARAALSDVVVHDFADAVAVVARALVQVRPRVSVATG
jgi:hypothetical protein